MGNFGETLTKIGTTLSPFAGIATGGLSMLQTGIEARQQRKNIELQNKLNLEQSQLEFDRGKEMFNLSNEYNSPSAQMARYKQAGLNPNLIYGQGSPGNAPNVLPQYRGAQLSANYKAPINVAGALNNAIETKLALQRLANEREQGKILQSEAVKKSVEADEWKDYWRYKTYGQYYDTDRKKHQLGIDFNQWQGNEAYKRTVQDGMYNRLKLGQLGSYNQNIALSKANEQLKILDIENYLPPWVRYASGLVGNVVGLAKGLIPKKLPVSTFERGFTPKGNFGTLKTIKYK
ncbi:MAG: DNA pilot protein [Microvirus sp.]|nr:MAG: DNA pilot protein [Microvirus sp.]